MTAVFDEATPAALRAARDVAPRIAAAADEIEQLRRLPDAIVQAIADADLFRLLVPADLGGAELDLPTFLLVIEEIAKADASVAWCLAQGAVCGVAAVQLDRTAAEQIWNHPRGVLAWGPGVGGTAQETVGGYHVTGSWSFASGGHHATWLGGVAAVTAANGTPRIGVDGRQVRRMFLYPAASVEFADAWYVSGLRGTGSDTFSVTNQFVPAAFALDPDLLPERLSSGELGSLYVISRSSMYSSAFASLSLGIARAMIDAFVPLAEAKTARFRTNVLREHPAVQAQQGHAEAELRAARAFLQQSVNDAWHSATTTRSVTLEQQVLIRLASTHAIRAAAHVVDTIYHAAGGTAIYANQPFERRFRDMNAITQQVQASELHFETAGRYFLGLDAPMVILSHLS